MNVFTWILIVMDEGMTLVFGIALTFVEKSKITV